MMHMSLAARIFIKATTYAPAFVTYDTFGYPLFAESDVGNKRNGEWA